ncbi:hypothetical protein J8J04_01990 ['Fragaria x ananassa' phyllody phytoplasma]|uniref:Uncharacterized protein n=1 Tax='Fragaria x ananassa' phyllody phytoplasma TaxID=2358428 RepID=A0ABS5K3H0_9MOLU|nr:hypothetical protein ['Fragaria x ananassa' phyllody phytoplasma]MBS2126454.1 hypothetical protein ['Fragaria x ananassa' phyllody phytoplasma]
MELFKILIFIQGLVVPFVIVPINLYFIHKKNKNQIKKRNVAYIAIAYYSIFTIILLGSGFFFFLNNKCDIIKNKVYAIPDSQIGTQDEWFHSEDKQRKNNDDYDYDSHRIEYSEEEKEFLKNNKSSKLKFIRRNGFKLEGTPMIHRNYIFYGIDGLNKCQNPEFTPNPHDLAPFIRNPFNKWKVSGSRFDYFNNFITLNNDNDSYFDDMFFHSPSNHNYHISYKGPKYLLEKDEDFFVDEVQMPFNTNSTKKNIYYIHFNPVKNYITLYTQKCNIINDY